MFCCFINFRPLSLHSKICSQVRVWGEDSWGFYDSTSSCISNEAGLDAYRSPSVWALWSRWVKCHLVIPILMPDPCRDTGSGTTWHQMWTLHLCHMFQYRGVGGSNPFENMNLLNSHSSCQNRPWNIANAKLLVLFHMCHTYMSNRKISKKF